MSLQVWLPLNRDPNMTPEITSYRKESGVTLTEDTDGWYKVQDTTHASGGRWGIYYDFNVRPNTTYTLYIYSKSTTGVSARIGIQSFVSNVGWPTVRDTNTGAEKLTAYTWTTGSSDTIARVYLALTTTATKANDYVFYKEPRIYEAPQNQGIANVMPIDSGVLYNNNGKIGGCYFFNNNGSRIIFPYHLQNKNKFTIALWLKSPTNSFKGCSFCFESNGMWKFATYNGVLCVRDDSRTSYSAGSRYEYSLGSVTANTWTHLICSYDAGQVKIYRDGILLSTNQTDGTVMDDYPGAVASIGADYTNLSTTGYYFNGYINDFRVYDYILSTQEIKELSRGLVVHYPLNNNGFGNENLMPNSIDTLVGSSNYNTGTWRLAGSSQMTRSRVAIPDSPIGASVYGFQSVGKQTGVDASCWGIDSFPRESGVTYTVSAWGRIVGGSTTAAMLGFSLYNATSVSYGGEYGEAKSSDTEYYGSGAYDYAGGKLRSDGKWTRIWRTFTSTASSGNIYIGFNTATTGDDVTLQLCGVKLEKGNSATPWCPNVSDTLYTKMGMNNNIVYDISGFNNNGTVTGALSTSSDTVRYKIATYFPNTTITTTLDDKSWIFTLINLNAPTALTVSFWFKKEAITRGGLFTTGTPNTAVTTLAVNDYDNNVRIVSNDGVSLLVGGYEHLTTNWCHWAMVFDGINAKIYINGVLDGNASYNEPKVLKDISQFVLGVNCAGGVHRSATGYYSDFRLYTTALSASDIQELYKMGREVN